MSRVQTSLSLILTLTKLLSMSSNIFAIFMNGYPWMRGIFASASMSSTIKSTENENLSIFIFTSLIVPSGFLQVCLSFAVLPQLAELLCTADSDIMFNLHPNQRVNSQLPYILPIGNIIKLWYAFVWSKLLSFLNGSALTPPLVMILSHVIYKTVSVIEQFIHDCLSCNDIYGLARVVEQTIVECVNYQSLF